MIFPNHIPKTKTWLILHLVAILLIMGYQAVLISVVGLSVTGKGVVIFLFQVIVYFVNAFWVVPTAFDEKKHKIFAFRIILLIALYLLMRGLVTFKPTSVSSFIQQLFSQEQQIYTSFQLILLLGTSFLLGFYWQNEKSRTEREEAIKKYVEAVNEKERIKTIIYQMQLNPHLTFNTLNAIKIQSEDQQPHIAKAVQLLANILRRSLIDPLEQEKIAFREVLNELRDVVALHQYLRSDKLFIVLKEEYDPTIDSLQIPPGIIFTLVDNVFSHGHLHEEEYPSTLALSVREKTLAFSTFNFKKIGTPKGNGLGLKNVRILLEHYYPGRHMLAIEDLEDTFTLNLIVSL